MAVTNIQAWADSLELVRLPLIIAELDDLNDVQNTYNALLSAKIQEFSDKFAQHSARITASQARADDAKDTANSALTQIYQTGLDAQTYTDMRIQSLRDELNLSLNATQSRHSRLNSAQLPPEHLVQLQRLAWFLAGFVQ